MGKCFKFCLKKDIRLIDRRNCINICHYIMATISWLADFTISNNYIRDECFTCKNKTEFIYFYIHSDFIFVDFRCKDCTFAKDNSIIILKTNIYNKNIKKDINKIMLLL